MLERRERYVHVPLADFAEAIQIPAATLADWLRTPPPGPEPSPAPTGNNGDSGDNGDNGDAGNDGNEGEPTRSGDAIMSTGNTRKSTAAGRIGFSRSTGAAPP